tara:strand:- start:105 stop:476 length:372 start_codon:yes stop_codon:yes gene_type:complete
LAFRTAFLEWALERFPDLAAEFESESARMRSQIAFSRFYHATQNAIDDGDSELVKAYFQIADRVLANAHAEMRSLFHVVFVEHLKFDDGRKSRSWDLGQLSARLRNEFTSSLGCSEEVRAKLN